MSGQLLARISSCAVHLGQYSFHGPAALAGSYLPQAPVYATLNAAMPPQDPRDKHDRAAEKAASRERDQRDIAEGRKTAGQVARENCVLPIGTIRWDLCKRLA